MKGKSLLYAAPYSHSKRNDAFGARSKTRIRMTEPKKGKDKAEVVLKRNFGRNTNRVYPYLAVLEVFEPTQSQPFNDVGPT